MFHGLACTDSRSKPQKAFAFFSIVIIIDEEVETKSGTQLFRVHSHGGKRKGYPVTYQIALAFAFHIQGFG